jgi:hypothetical protein
MLSIRTVWKAVFNEDVTGGKKSGPEQFRVICPFHHDHAPSCDVSLAKDAFICRSCGAHGGYLYVVIRAGYAENNREAMAWLERRGVV